MFLLPVRIGSSWVALEAQSVEDVLGTSRWYSIPGAPSRIPGIVAWRGRAIAVLDLGSRLGIAPALDVSAPRPRTVVVKVGESFVALLADVVKEVREVGDGALRPSARLRDSRGDIDLDGVPTPLLELSALVRE